MERNPESLLAHDDFIRGLAHHLVFDAHQADDVAQEAWLTALSKPPRKQGSMRSWFATVARNIARQSHRDDKSRIQREKAVARREAVEGSERVLERETVRKQVVDAVLSLDDPYQATIILRFYDDLPPREIAKRLEIPVETVKTHLKRGLAQLRQKLDTQHGGDRRMWLMALVPLAGVKVGAGTVIGGVIAVSTKIKVTLATFMVAASLTLVWMLFISDYDEQVERSEPAYTSSDSWDEGAKRMPGVVSTARSTGALQERKKDGAADVQLINGSGVPVLGRLLDQNGNVVTGAYIEETQVEVFIDWRLLEEQVWIDTGCRSKDNGRFTVVVPEERLPLTYLRINHPNFRSQTVPLGSAVTDFDNRYVLEDRRLDAAYKIEGQVVDFRGDPVSDCTVTAPGTAWERYKWKTDDLAFTDEKGRFLLKVRKNESMRITAYHEERGHGWSHPIMPGLDGNVPDVKVILNKCASISGILSMPDGTPAAGKHLFARSDVNGYEISRRAEADEKGIIRFPPLPMASYRIEAESVGIPFNLGNYKKDRIQVLAEGVVPGRRNLRLFLPTGSLLKLHLVDYEGASLDVEAEVKFMQCVYRTAELRRIKTNATHCGFEWSGEVGKPEPGTFIYDNLQPGVLEIDIRAEGYPVLTRMIEIPKPPGTAEYTFTLHRAPSISGQVFCSEGNPVLGAEVLVERVDRTISENWACFTHKGVRARAWSRAGKRVVTDENGSFRVEGIRYAEYLLVFKVKGREVFTESGIEVTHDAPQAETKVTLPLMNGSITGTIRDGNSAPLSDACVVAWNGDLLFNMTRADEKGRYGFFGMSDGKYIVDARALCVASTWHEFGRGWNRIKKGFEDLKRLEPFNATITGVDPCHLDLIVPDPWNSVIEGRIFVGSRSLPEGLNVTLSEVRKDETDRESRRPTSSDLFLFEGHANDRDHRIDHYRFEDLRAGRYQVRVEWFGYLDSKDRDGRWIESEIIHLEPSSIQTLDITIGFATLRGTIVEKISGGAVPGAEIHLEKKDSYCYLELDGEENGSFEIESIPAGIYELIVHHPSYEPCFKTNLVVLENVDIVDLLFEMVPGYSVTGKVKLEENTWDLYRWFVWPVIPPLGQYTYAGGRVLEDGSFTIQGLPAGRFTFLLKDGSKTVDEKKYSVPLAEGTEIVFKAPLESK